MRKGKIDKVIVGADRITRDAVFNKIGTQPCGFGPVS
jgi:methylthioribose-1-phosphate isomerase